MQRLAEAAASKLSPAQQTIFDEIDFSTGLTVCEAAAGAGKTRTLSFLVLKALMSKDVNEVCILTSTRTAKEEALARVCKLHVDLGYMHDGACPQISTRNVRTIHSVCLEVAREANMNAGGAGVDVVSPGIVRAMLEDILQSAPFNSAPFNGATLDGATFDGASLDDQRVSPDDVLLGDEMPASDAATLLANVRTERLQTCQNTVDSSFGPTAMRALAELEKRLECSSVDGAIAGDGIRRLDFAAMIEDFRKSGRPIVGNGDVLFVDECQDLTRSQLAILANTLKHGCKVVVLGDESQGIFQFSGAACHTISTLKTNARGLGIPIQRFGLMQNHRSTHSIVRASEALLPAEDRELRVGIQGNGQVGAPVEVFVANGECQEAGAVASKVVQLVESGAHAAGDIVILRHRNFQWTDVVVQEVKKLAGEAGVCVPVAIAGVDQTQSLSGKVVTILQSLDVEAFCVEESECMELLKCFLSSLRIKGWNKKLGLAAIKKVLESRGYGDPLSTLVGYQEEILAEFRLEEAKEDAEQAEKEARSAATLAAANNPKKKKRKRAFAPLMGYVGPSQKETNFQKMLKSAARVVNHLRQRVKTIEEGKTRLDSIAIGGTGSSGVLEKRPPPEATPTLRTPLAGLVWLIIRDVVGHDFSARDANDIQRLVSEFDFEYDANSESLGVIAAISGPLMKLSNEIHDKATSGKLVFSTIHKFKGLERPVAFAIGLSEPWASPKWPRRATLVLDHLSDCANKSGKLTACCAPFSNGMQTLKSAEISERKRLYYVAASRAKERLFLSGQNDPKNASCRVYSPLVAMAKQTRGAWASVEAQVEP